LQAFSRGQLHGVRVMFWSYLLFLVLVVVTYAVVGAAHH
jgi:hypothetical protein